MEIDKRLTLVYKEMFGLQNVENNQGNDTIFQVSTNIKENLYNFGDVNVLQSYSMNNNLYVENDITCDNISTNRLVVDYDGRNNNNITFNSSLDILGDIINDNSIRALNNVKFQNDVTVLTFFNINNLSCNNTIHVDNIISIDNLKPMNIIANTINIGHSTTITKIYGTGSNIITDNLIYKDKILSLNIDANNQLNIPGMYGGIEIKTTGNTGFIKVSDNSDKFLIKLPNQENIEYIATSDGYDENFIISGNAILHNRTTINSSLYIYGETILNGNTTILSKLNLAGDSIINGSTKIKGNLYISGSSLLNNTTFNSTLCINGLLTIDGNSTFNSKLNILGETTITNNVTVLSDFNVLNKVISHNDIIFNSNTFIDNYVSVDNNISFLSKSFISGNANINIDTIVKGTIIVNKKTLFHK